MSFTMIANYCNQHSRRVDGLLENLSSSSHTRYFILLASHASQELPGCSYDYGYWSPISMNRTRTVRWILSEYEYRTIRQQGSTLNSALSGCIPYS
eukprot:scaffold108130_cov39-Prasinocladus_malaysianus.AAC.1